MDELAIETEAGRVTGAVLGGVRCWRGIPFAAPPTGRLRLRAPEPALPWRGSRDAATFGALPMQKRGFKPMGGAGRFTPMSEDCLTLNISAPLGPSLTPRPVVVWIYGGGFTLGGTRTPLYRGDSLVRAGDIVFVSINYRLGVLGYADFSSWSSDVRRFDSNLGLRDQIAALGWIRRNIAAFGGDPDSVTIMGQSAGAASVLALMVSPAARGLFHRALALSPSAGAAYTKERHRAWSSSILRHAGVDPTDRGAVLRALEGHPAERLVAAASRFYYDDAPDSAAGLLPSSLVIDGDILPKSIVRGFHDGDAAQVPLIIGTATREGAMLDKALPVIPTTTSRIEMFLEHEAPSLRGPLRAAYAGYPSRRSAIDIGGDLFFWLPSIEIASAHARYAPCWMYRYDYATAMTRAVFGAATHGLDLPMLFGTTQRGALGVFDWAAPRRSMRMSRQVQSLALEFSNGVLPDWPRYDSIRRLTAILDDTPHHQSDPRRERREAWKGLPLD